MKEKTKVKIISVSEALRFGSGYYAIRGIITSVTEVYHMERVNPVRAIIGGSQ